MKIKQGFVSMPMRPFGFLQQYNLAKYNNRHHPVVMFGCYKSRVAYHFLRDHRGPVVIYWMGVDSWELKDVKLRNYVLNRRVTNVTDSPKIKDFMENNYKIPCRLIKTVARHKPKPTKKGDKVYTYLNKSKPDYHGKDYIDKLKLDHELIIGDGSFTKDEWNAGEADKMYRKCFTGLFLSDYVGGGVSIQEMGLRGIPAITNVLNLPHCIPWESVEDIQESIEKLSEGIGKTSRKLAEQVYSSMIPEMQNFNLDRLLI